MNGQSPSLGAAASRPGKDRIRVLLLENISARAVRAFETAGYSDIRLVKQSLEGAALEAALEGVHILGIRSRTHLTPRCSPAPAS